MKGSNLIIALLLFVIILQAFEINRVLEQMKKMQHHYYMLMTVEGVKCQILNVECEERK